MKKILSLLILIPAFSFLQAQDYPVSGSAFSPVELNPATTGILGSSILRINTLYDWRLNYERVGMFNEFSRQIHIWKLTADKCLMKDKLGLGGGLNLCTGNEYRLLQEGFLTAGWHQPLPNGFVVSGGLCLSLNYLKDLKYITRSPFQQLYPDLNAGILLSRKAQGQRFIPWLGLTLNHLFEPDLKYFSPPVPLSLRYIVNGGSEVRLTEKLYITPKALLTLQGDFRFMETSLIFGRRYNHKGWNLGCCLSREVNSFYKYDEISLIAGIEGRRLNFQVNVLPVALKALRSTRYTRGFLGIGCTLPSRKDHKHSTG